jgi:hypothetical protein
MNSHVLVMLVLTLEMVRLLGAKLGCQLEHLYAAVLLHNIDRTWLVAPRNADPQLVTWYTKEKFDKETKDCPFAGETVEEIREAIANHSQMYDQTKGSQLQRRLQELDMLSRLNCFLPLAAAAHHLELEPFNMERPWLKDMDADKRHGRKGHSLYTHLMGVVLVWPSLMPAELQPMINKRLLPLIVYLRSLAENIAMVTGQENQFAVDLKIALNGYHL